MRKRKSMKKMPMKPMSCCGISRCFAWSVVAVVFAIVAISPIVYM